LQEKLTPANHKQSIGAAGMRARMVPARWLM